MPDLILGIDPGSRQTGYALLTEEDGKLKALRCDVIYLAKQDDHSERLRILHKKITQIVNSFEPDVCSIETPIYSVDPQAMLKLGRAQAAAILAFTTRQLPVFEYYPKVVKKSITGNGNASKEQVAYMLHKMVSLPREDLQQDATDALAVAWCHMIKQGDGERDAPSSSKKQHQNRKESDWSEFIKNNPDRIRRF